MDGHWIIERDFDEVVRAISSFRCSEVTLDILPLERGAGTAVFACYVPTRPRPISVIVGEIRVERLAEGRTDLHMLNFPAWADAFIRSLVVSFGARG